MRDPVPQSDGVKGTMTWLGHRSALFAYKACFWLYFLFATVMTKFPIGVEEWEGVSVCGLGQELNQQSNKSYP